LQGIKIHFHEFLYDFALKRNKLLGHGLLQMRLLSSFISEKQLFWGYAGAYPLSRPHPRTVGRIMCHRAGSVTPDTYHWAGFKILVEKPASDSSEKIAVY
jgi:hypothetical protein